MNETWLSRRNRNSFAYLNQNYQKNPQDVHKNSFNPHDHSLNQQSNQVSCVNDKNMSLSVNITQTSNEKNFSAMRVGRPCNEDKNNF